MARVFILQIKLWFYILYFDFFEFYVQKIVITGPDATYKINKKTETGDVQVTTPLYVSCGGQASVLNEYIVGKK